MVNKVLVTYESSPLSEVGFLIAQQSREGMSILQEAVAICPINRRSNELHRQLAGKGIEVIHLRDRFSGSLSDGTFRECVNRLAEEADLILHDHGRFLHQLRTSKTIDLYREQLDDVVSQFYWKTHMETHNDYSGKRKALEIVNSESSIPTPKIWTVGEFLSSPQYPAVFQGRFGSMGDLVTYINTSQDIAKAMTKTPKNYEDNADFYEFINTPSDHFTSYRIVTFADGSIMAAVVQASERIKSKDGFANITSNHATGSHQIPLSPTKDSVEITEADYLILEQHGIARDRVQLPSDLEKKAGEVAKIFSKYGVLWAGQDWLQDRNGKFYFKEINIFPGMEAFNTLHMRGRSSDNCTEQHNISLEAQRIGLAILVNSIKEYQPVKLT